jgi:F0F1-type ATP synthase assembly protein I
MDDTDPPTAANDPASGSKPDDVETHALSPGATAFMGLGLSVGVSLAVMVGAGVLIDDWLHCAPYGLLAGLALGVVMAVMMVVATVRKYL